MPSLGSRVVLIDGRLATVAAVSPLGDNDRVTLDDGSERLVTVADIRRVIVEVEPENRNDFREAAGAEEFDAAYARVYARLSAQRRAGGTALPAPQAEARRRRYVGLTKAKLSELPEPDLWEAQVELADLVDRLYLGGGRRNYATAHVGVYTGRLRVVERELARIVAAASQS